AEDAGASLAAAAADVRREGRADGAAGPRARSARGVSRHRTGAIRRPFARDDRCARRTASDARAAAPAPAARRERPQARHRADERTRFPRGDRARRRRPRTACGRRFRPGLRLRARKRTRPRSRSRGAAPRRLRTSEHPPHRTDDGGLRGRRHAAGMTTLRGLVGDDEPLARKVVRTLLASCADVGVAAECEDGDALASALERLEADVLLLDVRMPGRDVFDVLGDRARTAPQAMPAVIFTTAYERYAVRAFELNAA